MLCMYIIFSSSTFLPWWNITIHLHALNWYIFWKEQGQAEIFTRDLYYFHHLIYSSRIDFSVCPQKKKIRQFSFWTCGQVSLAFVICDVYLAFILYSKKHNQMYQSKTYYKTDTTPFLCVTWNVALTVNVADVRC